MRKWIFTILLCLCLGGGMASAAWAVTSGDGSDAANSSATETWTDVSTPQAVIDVFKKGGNVKLTDSINIDGSDQGGLQIGVKVNLDLNGKLLTLTFQDKTEGLSITSGGALTVSSSRGSGELSSHYGIAIRDGGSLTLNSGTIKGANGNGEIAAIDIGGGATFTMSGGTLKTSVFGSEGDNFYLNGGEIDTGDEPAIKISNTGVIYANGGKVSSTAKNAVELIGVAGTNGGRILRSGTNKTIFDCNVLLYVGVIDDGIYNRKVTFSPDYFASNGQGVAKITGGTFDGEVECCDTIFGGTFNGAITAKAYSTIYTSKIILGTNATITTASGCSVVTYYLADGKEYARQAVTTGNKTSEPKIAPKKTGYIFGGWYKDDGSAFNFANTDVTSDLNLYAKWDECSAHEYDGDNICTKCEYKKITYSGGGSSYTATQKPTVAETENGKVTLSADGRTATITPDEGYEVAKVMVNSQDKGAPTTLTGLKTGDKIEATFQKTKETLDAETKAAVAALSTMKARSSRTAKGNVKVVAKLSNAEKVKIAELKDLGYTVKYRFYRSTKKASSYKAMLEGTTGTYINTTGKAGNRYYYKTQISVYDMTGKLIAKTALKDCKYATRIW